MIFRTLLVALLISCQPISNPFKKHEELTEQEWSSLYNFACQRLSIETSKLYVFSHVEDEQVICKQLGEN